MRFITITLTLMNFMMDRTTLYAAFSSVPSQDIRKKRLKIVIAGSSKDPTQILPMLRKLRRWKSWWNPFTSTFPASFIRMNVEDSNPCGITYSRYLLQAIKAKKECSLKLLNYKKDGSRFMNQFFLTPLYKPDKKTIAYYIGVQKEIDEDNMEHENSFEGENPGWRCFFWLWKLFIKINNYNNVLWVDGENTDQKVSSEIMFSMLVSITAIFSAHENNQKMNAPTTRAKKLYSTFRIDFGAELILVEYDQFPHGRLFAFLKKDHHDMITCKYVDFKGIPQSLFGEMFMKRDAKVLRKWYNVYPKMYWMNHSIIERSFCIRTSMRIWNRYSQCG